MAVQRPRLRQVYWKGAPTRIRASSQATAGLPAYPEDRMHPQDNERPARDAFLDVGETLCGELALMLRAELRKLEPGQVIEVVARDPAAPQDLPAWCELTGNSLLHAAHPHYWIRRKNH